MSRKCGSTVDSYMGTKSAGTHPGSPPAPEREDQDRATRLASVGQAVELLSALDRVLGCTDAAELGRLASEAREGGRSLEEWARHVEAFRASKQLFEAGILPDPAARPRVADEPVRALHPYNERLKAQADKRRARLRKLKDSGLTYQQIPDKLGITRQRAYQILNPETST